MSDQPVPPAPVGRYVPAVRAGALVYVSGQGPVQPDGRTVLAGDLTAAATVTMQNVLAAMGEARVLRLLIMAATDDPEVLSEATRAALAACPEPAPVVTAVGMTALPFGIPVEIEAIGEIA
jgi:enamine deaminase RidA (YjgF/YER057c/UK114 family)